MARPSSRVVALASFAFASTLLLGFSAGCAGPATDADGVRRSVIPVNAAWAGARPYQLSISADGQRVVYQTNKGDGWKLYIHKIGEPSGTVVPGLGAVPYFGQFSPNGDWLLFGQKGWLWKVPSGGGDVMKVHGGNNWSIWDTDSTFLISRGVNGLSRVTADGSLKREDIAAVDQSTGATTYIQLSMLPGGKGAVVSVNYGTGVDKRHIGVVSLPGGKLTVIPEPGALNPRYSASGHILYTVDNVLKAIPFDVDRLEVAGDAATIVEGVQVLSNAASDFDISANGVLVYVPGPYEAGRAWPRFLVWAGRDGSEQTFHTTEKSFGIVRLSPNRRYVAAEGSGGASLFVHDNVTGTWTRLAESATGNGGPVWAADSSALFYTQGFALGRYAVDASGVWTAWKELMPGDTDHGFWGFSLSADGAQVLGTTFVRDTPEVWQLAQVSTSGAKVAEPLLGASSLTRRNPALSRDGDWLAYVEKDKGGIDRVYVEPYPSGGNRLLVSEGDAAEPVWGRGLELFYRDAANMVSARLAAAPELRVVETTPLFPTRHYANYLNTFAATYDYDPATDRFLMAKSSIPDRPGTDIQVIQNAFEVLNRLAPPKK